MLTGSMETVPSSYEDSAIFMDQAEDFGFIGEDDLEEEEFERVENDDDALQPHTISRHGSVDGDDNDSQNQDDELTSTGILILGPSQMTTTLRIPRASTADNPTLSPRLSLPDTEYLPTDLNSIHLDSIAPSVHSSASSVMVEDNSLEEQRLRRKPSVDMTYSVLGSFFILVLLCIFVCSTVSLLAERRSWVQSNQKLEDQMKRMHADWVNLAHKYELDQEASMKTSRTIKATLQAQMEEQRRIIEDLYREQRELKEKREQEKKERERRIQEEKAKQRFQRQEQARERMTTPPSSKNTNNFAKKKKFASDSPLKSKTFDVYWTDTEEAILKWSDETQHKLRTMLNGLSKKVWKAQAHFFQNADRTFQHVRIKIVQAWSDFYAALHQPQDEGLMAKAAPLVSTVLFATAAAALTEGTNRFVRYMQDDEE